MEAVKKEVVCTKEAAELMGAVVSLVKNAKLALADGFQPGQDLPVLLMGSMNDLLTGLNGLNLLGDEVKSTDEFVNALSVGALEIKSLFLKK